MTIQRMDLDGVGSPNRLADRIHELLPELEPGFKVHDLARELDIKTITKQPVKGFEAMLLTDSNRRDGHIILAEGRSFKRGRFSIGHELGHFLMAHHQPSATDRFECSKRDMGLRSTQKADRRQKWEVEANRFAARLLMPLRKLRPHLRIAPDLEAVVDLARTYKVSKDAMARTFAEHHEDPIAILVVENGLLRRAYRDPARFPYLAIRNGDRLPLSAEYFSRGVSDRELSTLDDADPDDWLTNAERANLLALREQVLWQQEGFAMVLLEAQIDDVG